MSHMKFIKKPKNFEKYLQNIINESRGINLPAGWVPCSSFWLINEYEGVVGVIRIRHRVGNDCLMKLGHIGYEVKSTCRNKGYGTKLLEFGLVGAHKLGIRKVLLTCD
ncbi:MAG: GNAT family N-acetyltransferase [Clostridia bacterium]|nr:GNAT family N-acetyltransferase [Clostridia bacterium]